MDLQDSQVVAAHPYQTSLKTAFCRIVQFRLSKTTQVVWSTADGANVTYILSFDKCGVHV